jgi:hypothetical protein
MKFKRKNLQKKDQNSRGVFGRYIAAILWVSDGEVHDGETWRLQCAYLQEEGNQELNRQQQPCADRPLRAVEHLRVGDASTPCGRRPQWVSRLWLSSTLLNAPCCMPHAVRPTPYALRPIPYAPRGMPLAVRLWLSEKRFGSTFSQSFEPPLLTVRPARNWGALVEPQDNLRCSDHQLII